MEKFAWSKINKIVLAKKFVQKFNKKYTECEQF